jgi:phospholipid/cholesterol/gamma-HCH transport system ATP-binding protein
MSGAVPAQMPRLCLRDLHKTLGERAVLRGVSIDVEAGRSLVILGGSGAGKSVTLKCALGLLLPDAGQVLVDGQDLTGVPASQRQRVNRKFGMLFQGGALFDSMPVWENVAFRLIYAERMKRSDAHEIAVETLRRVRLGPEHADKYPIELSGGMQKRVALARAIVTKPRILFFDEPTTGLDPITSDAINDLIVEMVKELGCAALSITHDIASAQKIGDECAMLYEGQIIWRGPAAQLRSSGDARVDQFVNGRSSGPIASIV